MRSKGINYETAFISKGVGSCEPLNMEIIKRELQIIYEHGEGYRVCAGGAGRC